MKAVISVIGKDTVGILANVSGECAKYGANIDDVTQSVLRDMFVMVMLVNIDSLSCDFGTFVDEMHGLGEDLGMDIRVMHEDIFNSMHRI